MRRVAQRRAGRAWTTSTALRARGRARCSMRSRPSSSQRGSTPEPRSGSSRRPSLSVGARQSCSRGPSSRTSAVELSSQRPVVDGRRVGRRLAPPPARRRAAGRRRDGSASCCQATSWPAGAQSVARRRKKRNVTNRSPAAARRSSSTSSASPGATRSAAGSRCTTSPSPVSSHVPRSRRGREVVAVPDPEACGRRRGSTRTGWARNLSSCSAGCGVRSGQTRPSAQKFASFGVVAEVAAVGPVVAAVAVGAPDAVVDPLPDEPALQRVVALEGGEVVGQPAVRVAHRVRVLAEDQRARIVVVRSAQRLDRVDARRTSGRRRPSRGGRPTSRAAIAPS